METPTSGRRLRPTRNPTPRLSERKKNLFKVQEQEDADEDEGGDIDESLLLDGIQPLRGTHNSKHFTEITEKRNRNIGRLLRSGSKGETISFFELPADTDDSSEQELLLKPTTSSQQHRRSPRLSQHSSCSSSPDGNKENRSTQHVTTITTAEEQLPHLFKESMRINAVKKTKQHHNSTKFCTPESRSKTPQITIIAETSSEDDDNNDGHIVVKENTRTHTKRSRLHMSPNDKSDDQISTNCKIRKTELVIPTRAFYSKSNQEVASLKHSSSYTNQTPSTSSRKLSPRSNRLRKSKTLRINRGVSHGIKKSTTNRNHTELNIDRILSQISNERLRNLIARQREEKAQIAKVHDILRSAKDPIKMARPLSVMNNKNDSNNNNNNNDTTSDKLKEARGQVQAKATQHVDLDFSDIEQSEDEDEDDDSMNDMEESCNDDNEKVVPLIRHDDIVISTTKSEGSDPETPSSNRKFFKSGRKSTTKMEVKITGNIRASVCNGKISLVQQKPRKQRRLKVKTNVANEFHVEQATVDAILKNLDDTAFGDIIEQEEPPVTTNAEQPLEMKDQVSEETLLVLQQVEQSVAMVNDNNDDQYADFRNRVPYETSDPMIIEQQNLLLDFLITNNICTEENFQIFIADPDNPDNRAAAARVVDDIVVVVNEEQPDFRQRLPFKTSDPLVIEQQEYFLDLLIKHNICTEENFDIFIANYEQRQNEATALLVTIYGDEQQQQQDEQVQVLPGYPLEMHAIQIDNLVGANVEIVTDTNNSEKTISLVEEQQQQDQEQTQSTQTTNATTNIAPAQKLFPIFTQSMKPIIKQKSSRYVELLEINKKIWRGGEGSNQYQLDLGQKAFGATQCKQCGLVYTAHEAEEEKLHRDYHASMHFLRFNGWIDEDIVGVYPEWSWNGRIIRVNDNSNTKRLDRLKAILHIVDKELGYSDYKLPKTFVIYFAVVNSKIVGICVVEPLEKACRFVNVDGIDYCSEEEFDVKCGISRIWVSPLARRSGIASKLINAVQMNTILGKNIPIEQIAFSSPTDVGKLFAQKITKTENFLVYQLRGREEEAWRML